MIPPNCAICIISFLIAIIPCVIIFFIPCAMLWISCFWCCIQLLPSITLSLHGLPKPYNLLCWGWKLVCDVHNSFWDPHYFFSYPDSYMQMSQCLSNSAFCFFFVSFCYKLLYASFLSAATKVRVVQLVSLVPGKSRKHRRGLKSCCI